MLGVEVLKCLPCKCVICHSKWMSSLEHVTKNSGIKSPSFTPLLSKVTEVDAATTSVFEY